MIRWFDSVMSELGRQGSNPSAASEPKSTIEGRVDLKLVPPFPSVFARKRKIRALSPATLPRSPSSFRLLE